MGMYVWPWHEKCEAPRDSDIVYMLNALYKAAGYLPHCRCGCSPATKEMPSDPAEEPLLYLSKAMEDYRMPWQHGTAVADRIDSLKDELLALTGPEDTVNSEARYVAQHLRRCTEEKWTFRFA